MFKNTSFFVSLLRGNLLLIAMILGIGFYATTDEVNHRAVQLTQRFQEQLLALVLDDLQDSWPDVEERIRQYCHSYSLEPEFRLTVIDTQGRVLGDSEYPSEKMEQHLGIDRPEIATALSGVRGEDVRDSKTKRIVYRYLAEPIRSEGQVVGVIRIAFPVAGFLENRHLLFRGVLFAFVLMLLAAVALSVLLSWLWYRPLREINETAQRIARGDLDPLPPLAGPLELRQLARAIDQMRQTVSSQLETISRQREGLLTILRNLPDAIFALNRNEQIIYYNEAAKELFRLPSWEEPRHIQSVIRNAGIIDFFEKRRRKPNGNNTIEHKEIELYGRKYFVELEWIGIETRAENDVAGLLILSDLTESVRTEKMKIDFVANASHELRTPLAAIRASLDNLSGDVCEDKETFASLVRIIERHVSRLSALIEDLLSLHEAENESTPTRLERTNLAEQRFWIEELFGEKIAEKRIAFSFEPENDGESFLIDNKRLGLILQNLVENAVKYTAPGGTISLRFERSERELTVICGDDGCGIAPEDQSRVFERFYQGDASKTGDGRIRGTGLGLAIVKHAVERLHGNVSLESRLGRGTAFTVRIPLKNDASENADT